MEYIKIISGVLAIFIGYHKFILSLLDRKIDKEIWEREKKLLDRLEEENRRNVIEDIEYVHPKKLVWDSTTDELKVCTREYPSGVELPENKFVVHKYKAKSGHASRAGIMRVVSWMYLFKNYDIKDWVR